MLRNTNILKELKNIKGLKTQNLRDHISEAELIFTALAELSTRQIAETMKEINYCRELFTYKKSTEKNCED